MNMRFDSRLFGVVTTMFLWVFLLPAKASENRQYSPLLMQGDTYPNSCLPENKEKIKMQLLDKVPRDTIQLWRAVEAILCAQADAKNSFYVKNLLQKGIYQSITSTGSQEERRKVEISDDLIKAVMARGEAWNANVQVESSKVILQYFSNEACVKSISFRHVEKRWTVYELGEACD